MTEYLAECYIESTDNKDEDAIVEFLTSNKHVIKPSSSRREDGHVSVMCGFNGFGVFKMIIGMVEDRFPGKVSWR